MELKQRCSRHFRWADPITVCLVQPILEIAQQSLWWHASVHTFMLPNRLDTSRNISQHLALLTAGFCIGLPGTSEDQEGGLLRGIPGGVKLFVMPIGTYFFALRSMKSSDINLKCHQNTFGPQVWGFHSTRSSWLHTANISVKFPLHSIPKLR